MRKYTDHGSHHSGGADQIEGCILGDCRVQQEVDARNPNTKHHIQEPRPIAPFPRALSAPSILVVARYGGSPTILCPSTRKGVHGHPHIGSIQATHGTVVGMLGPPALCLSGGRTLQGEGSSEGRLAGRSAPAVGGWAGGKRGAPRA